MQKDNKVMPSEATGKEEGTSENSDRGDVRETVMMTSTAEGKSTGVCELVEMYHQNTIFQRLLQLCIKTIKFNATVMLKPTNSETINYYPDVQFSNLLILIEIKFHTADMLVYDFPPHACAV